MVLQKTLKIDCIDQCAFTIGLPVQIDSTLNERKSGTCAQAARTNRLVLIFSIRKHFEFLSRKIPGVMINVWLVRLINLFKLYSIHKAALGIVNPRTSRHA